MQTTSALNQLEAVLQLMSAHWSENLVA
jgi:hypothetical protein